jgi:acetyl esterase/lipase
MTGFTAPTIAMQSVLDQLQALGARPLETMTPELARQQPSPADAAAAAARSIGLDDTPESVGDVQDRSFPGPAGVLPIRIYWPKNATPGDDGLPVVLYIHGGGWVLADLDAYDDSARALANGAGAIVVSTHYRQGPEDPFPAAHEDTYAAYRWVLENAASFGGDAARVALAGESAGGNMAANIAIRARDEGIQAPLHQVLVYPVANDDMASPSYRENANARPLGKAAMQWFVRHAFRAPEQAADPRIALVRQADLSNLPPATILLAQIDPLRSEGELLARKLKEAGNDVLVREWMGVTHEFFGMAALLPEASEAQQLAGERLAEAFAPQGMLGGRAARPGAGAPAQA